LHTICAGGAKNLVERVFENASVHPKSIVHGVRTAPCLLALSSPVSVSFPRLWSKARIARRSAPRYAKKEPTFSDAIVIVPRKCWNKFLKLSPKHAGALDKITIHAARSTLLR
jgi:hypothetical protein